MALIQDQARRAWQLCEQGHSIEEIAEHFSCTPQAVERWLLVREEIARQQHEKPWWDGLDGTTVSILRYAGIRSRADLVKVWESGDIEDGRIHGVGPRRQLEIRRWLAATREHGEVYPPKAMLIELPVEAEDALLTLERKTKHSRSDIISDLLLRAVKDMKKS